LFADGLNFPTGLLTWRDGVIVTAAPDILFLRDTNSDGQADERRVLFTGFFEGNQQLRVNGLRWGLDNWVYCANGGHHAGYGDKIKIASKITGKEIELGSRDFRFRPDTGEIEPESGPTQFGRNRDDWGNWFGVQNSWPLWHYVLSDRYLRRNPHVASPSPVQQVVTPGNPKVYPASALEKRFHSFDQSGRFTSACSAMIYRDELLFGSGYRHAFTCEPFHNVVQHNIITDEGVSFTFHRAPEEKQFDFFASEDRWCRPVMTRTGPEGALWVVDMYRYMIEHPQWLPANGRDELLPHYREGDDKGRIYRVVPATSSKSKVQGSKFRVSASQDGLSKASTSQLIAALDSPNGWIRDKAQQLLLWKGDKAALPLLEKAALESASPFARLHALCTLDGLQALKPDVVERALRDKHPGVRVNALRLAETHSSSGVIAAAAKLASDTDPKVRLQLAFSLGEWKDTVAGQSLAKLAIADHDDPFLRAAVLSSAVPHCAALVDAVLKAGDPALKSLSEPLLTLALGLNDRGSLARLLEPMLAATNGRFSGAQLESFGRFLDLLARRKLALADLKGNHSSDPLILTHARAQTLLTFASTVAGDVQAPLPERAAAVGLLAREPSQRERALQLLGGWLTPQTPAEIQRVAVRSLALTSDDQVPVRLLEHWPAASPETRATMLETLLSREPWTLALLDGVKADRVSPLAFDAARRAQLQRHQSQRVRGLANQLFKSGASSRAQIVEQFRPALALQGDAPRGQAVHAKLCVTCHKLGNIGNEVGPDLRSVVEHPPEKLLTNILDPSSDVQPGFFAYTVTLKNGEELYGLITSEAGSSVTLKLADGSTRAIVRNDIETLRGSNLSLMPEGLEAGLSQQDMADLIAFLKAPR
jgi:putative membrane-bound dehydrogenase-like protein